MFGWLRKKFGSWMNDGVRVRMKYDAANRNDPDNAEHWRRGVDALSADSANARPVRKILRERARYEVVNNSYLSGVLETLVNDTVGGGPMLQLSNDSRIPPGIAAEAEADWRHWMREAEIDDALRVIDRAKRLDGESFGLMATDAAIPGAVKIRLVPIECDRIVDPDGVENAKNIDGVLVDDKKRVVAYRVLRQHPGDSNVSGMDSFDVPADEMVHWFRRQRPGQHRGITDFVAALKIGPMLRRYTLATLRAAEMQADNGGVIECETDDFDESVLPEEPIQYERGMITALPLGYKFKGFDPTQPTSNHDAFTRTMLQEMGRGLGVPLVVMLLNASGFNFASGRLDHLVYLKSRRVERAEFASRVVAKIFRQWWREWRAVKGYRFIEAEPAAEFIFPGFEPLDIQKETAAWISRVEAGMDTLEDYWTQTGRDPERMRRRVERCHEWRRSRGIGVKETVGDVRIGNDDEDDGGSQRRREEVV